jgi:translation elongation factor EF-G
MTAYCIKEFISFNTPDFSNEMAFKIAGSMGFKEGARKADPALLEAISY